MNTAEKCLFIYTNSHDQFTDAIVRRLGTDRVFRFNLDLWMDYAIDIKPDTFSIANPAGRSVSASQIVKFLWRSPKTKAQLFPEREIPSDSTYEDEEICYAMRELWNLMHLQNRAVLISPLADSITGKLVQAKIASKFFAVPSWNFTLGKRSVSDRQCRSVVKSLVARRVQKDAILFTTLVEEAHLAQTKPWMIQDYVEAQYDITVLFIRDAIYSFQLRRDQFPDDVVDWRYAAYRVELPRWSTHTLTPMFSESVGAFMQEMGLHYGRLDLLLGDDNRYYFLEVNPNGEWSWLDPDGKIGIIDKLIAELSPDTRCNPLPNPRLI